MTVTHNFNIFSRLNYDRLPQCDYYDYVDSVTMVTASGLLFALKKCYLTAHVLAYTHSQDNLANRLHKNIFHLIRHAVLLEGEITSLILFITSYSFIL